MPSVLPVTALAVLAALASPVSAQRTIGGNSGPQYNYVCPNADGGPPLDCYFDAVRHLYTMCRHVKSIEIIEWGFEKSQEGVNNAKTISCIDKQRGNMHKPYQAALRTASISKQATDAVRDLQTVWVASLEDLTWRPGETGDDYLTRTVTPYMEFEERIAGIQIIVDTVKAHVRPAPSKSAAPKAATPKSAAK
ncbi:MAG: hypothetical protein AMXMBFR42_13150 [Burkholderiales bacterium]